MAVHSKAIVRGILPEDYIRYEYPAGSVNGINTIFILANTPIIGTVEVFYNGLSQTPIDDYTIVGNMVTFIKAPRANRDMYVHYIKQV